MIKHEFMCGTRIGEAAKVMCDAAIRDRQSHEGTFNDITILATPDDTAEDVVRRYHEASERRAAEYRKSTQGKNCREVLRKEREERAAESARLGNALHTLRAENNALENVVSGLRKSNAELLAQLALAERIIVAGLRG